MSNELGRTLFILAVVVFLGWFAAGTHWNVRKGHRLLGWLQEGMPLLGAKTTLRWLGSSAIELKVTNALAPLRSVDVLVVLEPRDLPFLWWLFHARGRRDLLIVRAQLGATPRFELEALDLRAWSTRGIERAVRRNQWTPVAVPPGSPLVAYSRGASDAAARVLPIAVRPELSPVRVAVHHNSPHLEVQWTLAGLDTLGSRRVLETVHRLAETVAGKTVSGER
ncbi:MAG TPA: hypothetical protein VIW28_12975 [Gemmatimonadales bacterium]|jgi:hypothetical protein